MYITGLSVDSFCQLRAVRVGDIPWRYYNNELTWEQEVKLHEQEMNTFKIKLENMFCTTDSTNEKIDIMQELLNIGCYLLSSKFKPLNAIDDFGRHTEMALKIAPKKCQFLLRNEICITTTIFNRHWS